MSAAHIGFQRPTPSRAPVPDLCPACGGGCCESCAGIGSGDAYRRCLIEAAQAVADEILRQQAEALVWRAHERAKQLGGELGELIRGDLAEALALLGGE